MSARRVRVYKQPGQKHDPHEALEPFLQLLYPVAEVVKWSKEEQKHDVHLFEVNVDETIASLWSRIVVSLHEGWGQWDEITLRFMTTLEFHQRVGNYSPPEEEQP